VQEPAGSAAAACLLKCQDLAPALPDTALRHSLSPVRFTRTATRRPSLLVTPGLEGFSSPALPGGKSPAPAKDYSAVSSSRSVNLPPLLKGEEPLVCRRDTHLWMVKKKSHLII